MLTGSMLPPYIMKGQRGEDMKKGAKTPLLTTYFLSATPAYLLTIRRFIPPMAAACCFMTTLWRSRWNWSHMSP